MPTSFDLAGLRFAAPAYLPLLALPVLIMIAWVWQAWRRRGDVAQMRRHRQLPTLSATERLPVLGDLAFWLSLNLALACVIVAIARPVAVASMVRTSGIDLVILQDGSSSMRVRDIGSGRDPQPGSRLGVSDRWRRSMTFLRTLAESLQWEDDRIALALFATIATPQVRLTRDPNTFFFFLDHLDQESPFRVEDDTSWDTNIERGIYWGLRLVNKDEEMRMGSAKDKRETLRRPTAFVLISDGQAWSGSVAKSITLAQERRIPLFVIGVGTTSGGVIPEPNRDPMRAAVSSSLERSSLSMIATAGGGRYFELDRESDRDIANAIIDATRRRAEAGDIEESTRDLYWTALMAAAIFLGLGVLFLRDRASLALQLVAAVGALIVLANVS